ncbi:MAG: hypothetical protein E7548_00085 [Ruminococcaceae bacterium]|nr:hypothetical protein [Oscillospiraceae bacterium]
MRSVIKQLLLYIKYLGFILARQILKLFNIFPIKNNRILFHSFNGRQYSCNPRAISEAAYDNYGSKLEIVWAFNNPRDFEEIVPEYVKRVKMSTLKYYYLAKTSRVIICNARGSGIISKRKGQCVIQTWHASNGYKKIDGEKGIYGKLSKLACKDFSYVNAGCENMVRERVNGTMGFYGPIINGTPRMDFIFNSDRDAVRKKVFGELKIPEDYKIVLYAPTYRSSKQNEFGLEYDAVVSALEKKFGGKWAILVRMHYFVVPSIENASKFIDATKYPDIQDLMVAADVLISDYSSCIWDFSFLNRPCFLYCSDLDFYEKKVNFNFPIREWGFPLAVNSQELVNCIENFDINIFSKNMAKHHKCMGNFEDGQATKRVLDIISDNMNLNV